jgi:hypothetical protein
LYEPVLKQPQPNQLWESHAKPHLYHFTAKFWKKARDTKPATHRESDYERLFFQEYQAFTEFFENKTGVAWGDRVRMVGIETNPTLFHYQPPVSDL